MPRAKKGDWHSRKNLARRFARLSMARRLELAEESERFRRKARIIGARRRNRRP